MEILNSQLMYHTRYPDLLCNLKRLNMSETYKILTNDFNWNKTGNMVRMNDQKSCRDDELFTLIIYLPRQLSVHRKKISR